MPSPLDSGRDICPATKKSVKFLKERDILLRNDVWRIAIDVKIELYEEALSIIRGELLTV